MYVWDESFDMFVIVVAVIVLCSTSIRLGLWESVNQAYLLFLIRYMFSNQDSISHKVFMFTKSLHQASTSTPNQKSPHLPHHELTCSYLPYSLNSQASKQGFSQAHPQIHPNQVLALRIFKIRPSNPDTDTSSIPFHNS